jgi:transposase
MTADDINLVKMLRHKGQSIRAIAMIAKRSTRTVQDALVFNGEDMSWHKPRHSSLDQYKEEIEKLLVDSHQWGKQALNLKNALKILLERHPDFSISYEAFCAFVRKRCTIAREDKLAAIPIDHQPGEAQIDFFDAIYYRRGKRIEGHGFTMSFPHSDCKLLQLYPAENQQCLLHAIMACFEAIGFVPRSILFDNAVTAVIKIIASERTLHPKYAAFAAHYGFEAKFCNPGRGREKGGVERNNAVMRSQYLSPPPHITDEESFNKNQLSQCIAVLSTTDHYRKRVIKSALFAEDRSAGLPLPKVRFDERITLHRKSNNCGMIRVQDSDYSVSDKHAKKAVFARLGAFTVDIVDEYGKHICTHKRSYTRGSVTISHEAYAEALAARPKAILSTDDGHDAKPPQKCIKKTSSQYNLKQNESYVRPSMRSKALQEVAEIIDCGLSPPAPEELSAILYGTLPYEVDKDAYTKHFTDYG